MVPLPLSPRKSSDIDSYLEHVEGEPKSVELLGVRDAIDLHASRLIEVFVMARRPQLILLGKFLVPRAGLDQLIEYVIIALLRALKGDATLLQQIVLDDAALNHPFVVEAHLHELAESRAVVVSHGLCVTYIDRSRISILYLFIYLCNKVSFDIYIHNDLYN